MTPQLKAELAQALSVRGVGLRFPAQLEMVFNQDVAPQRARAMLFGGGFGLLLYMAFLVVDWLVVPDVFELAVIRRLGLITPLGLLPIHISQRYIDR